MVFTKGGNGRHATVSTTDLQFLGIDVDRDVESFMDKVKVSSTPGRGTRVTLTKRLDARA